MGLRNFVCMNIAVIGNGAAASGLAERLAIAGHIVTIGLKEDEDDDILISTEAPEVYFDNIAGAAADADVIFMAMPADRVRETAYLLGDVRNKIIIDISGNVLPRPAQYVYTVRALRSITGANDVIKSFQLPPIFEKDGNDVFFAGDSLKAKAVARIIANDLGFMNTFDLGDQNTIPLLEDMARCWQIIGKNPANKNKVMFKIIKK
jgi:predicted dinucleotide-binding enzyme